MSESKEIEKKEESKDKNNENEESLPKKQKLEELKKIPLDTIKDRLIYINNNDTSIVTEKEVYSEKKEKNFKLYQCMGHNCEGNAIILEGWDSPGKCLKDLLDEAFKNGSDKDGLFLILPNNDIMNENALNQKVILKRKEPAAKDQLYHPNSCIKEIIHVLIGKRTNCDKKVSLKTLSIQLPEISKNCIYTLNGDDIDDKPNEWKNILDKNFKSECEIDHDDSSIFNLEDLITN